MLRKSIKKEAQLDLDKIERRIEDIQNMRLISNRYS